MCVYSKVLTCEHLEFWQQLVSAFLLASLSYENLLLSADARAPL